MLGSHNKEKLRHVIGRDPIKLIIGLGFTGVLALMGLTIFITLTQMNTITEQMSATLEETNAKISSSNAMRDAIRIRGIILFKMYLTDDYIERDQYRLEFANAGLHYKQARDQLNSYSMSSREANLLNQLRELTESAKALNDTAAESLLSDLPVATVKQDLLHALDIELRFFNRLLNRLGPNIPPADHLSGEAEWVPLLFVSLPKPLVKTR